MFIWDDELDHPRVIAMLQKIAEKNHNREADGGCSKYQNLGSTSSNNIDNPSSNVEVGCNKCGLLSEHLREFGKDIGKEIGIEFGKELGKEYAKENASKKLMKTKKKLQYERKKSSGLMIGLVLSWIFFSVVFKLM